MLRIKYLPLPLLWCFLLYACAAGAQTTNAPDSLPYLKYPAMPAFEILLTDSATKFNTFSIPEGKPTVLVFYSPDCDHCQKMTEQLIKGMDSLKHMQFVWLTFMDLKSIKSFANTYQLHKHRNIIAIGKDEKFFFPSFYKIKYVPYIAVYDKRKQFLKLYEGNVTVQQLLDVTK